MKGAVRVEMLLEQDDLFEPGRRVRLTGRNSETARDTEIEYFRRQHGRVVVKFRGIDSITEAEKYVGCEAAVPTGELPALGSGWFYTFQLKGCSVFTTDGEHIGTVRAVIDSGGTEILSVDHEGKEILIPFAEPYMKNIDLAQRRIQVHLPADLKELNR